MGNDRRTCTGCSRTFTPRQPNQKFCGRNCRARTFGKLYKAKLPEGGFKPSEKKCRHCGSTFVQKHTNHNYCSQECSTRGSPL
jgi:hypothetical protein